MVTSGEILKGGGAILIVLLVGLSFLAPFLESAGVTFKTNYSLLVTFIGFALIMGALFVIWDLATVKFEASKLLVLGLIVVAIFLTVKFGLPLINKFTPIAASIYPLP